jgi:hypothetical protein
MRKLGISLILVIFLLSVISIAIVPSNAGATAGTITVAPGETKYITFSSAEIDDMLLWDIEISYLGWSLTYWLESPLGSHVTIDYLDYWGEIVNYPGVWKIGFNIDSGGIWSATIDYGVYRLSPNIEFISPDDGSYVNETSITVTGTYSDQDFFQELEISTDDINYHSATTHLGSWSAEVSSLVEGANTIYTETAWGWPYGYQVSYSDSIDIIVDLESPDLMILTPTANSAIRGTYVNVTWQASDDYSIAKKEVKIDATGWQTVSNNYFDANLATGTHIIKVRITDKAGNQNIQSVTISIDAEAFSFGGPLYGLPSIGIITAIVLSAIYFYLLVRTNKRKKAPAFESMKAEKPLEPEEPPQPPLQHTNPYILTKGYRVKELGGIK